MKLGSPGVWLSAASLVLVVAVVVSDLERTSPGPVSAVHARVAELDGGRNCDACHGGWLRSMGASCNTCHEEIGAQLAEGRGLHGAIEAVEPESCEACHAEHLGAEFQLVHATAFALAGFDRDRFDHGHVAFALTGRHGELTCAECHEHADVEVLEDGAHRFLGLTQECAACHDDPHAGRFERSCDSCHGQTHPFAELANFVHTADFPLTGAHAGHSCADCHAAGGGYEVEDLAGSGPRPPDRACADCHSDSPHSDAFVEGVAVLADLRPAATCALCHDGAHESFAGERDLERSLHAASGFALEAPHAELACAACHGAEASFAERYPGRSGDDCAACHDDPHGEQFADATCLDCHGETRFFPSTFGLAAHASTAFPLDGGHAAVACSACHRVEDDVRRFTGTTTACADCHEDAHGDAFADAGGCADCHVPTAFADVERARFDHAASTGFALEGAHAAASCEACHPRAAHPDELGRSFGRVAAAFGEPVDACATCHADVHGELFAGEACDVCHSTAAFAPATDFEHADTGFALTGAHASAECASCHGTYPDPRAAGRTLGRVAEVLPGPLERCDTCHADPHGGAFDAPGLPTRVEDRSGCARCHTTTSFRDQHGAFDHALWTGHPLAGAHAALDCAACHAPAASRALGPVRGADCADCHADPHVGQFLAEGRTDCRRCHGEGDWRGELSFDHATDARFALDESHEDLDCAVCHVPWPLAGGGEAVRYKPLGTRCVDCHDHGGRGR